MGKYDYLFYEFEPQETSWGEWCHSPQAYFRGNADLPGSNLNVGFQVFKAPVYLEREPHFHREEEYLIFMGAQFPDVFSSWDAEVELFIGPSLDDMQRIVIDRPTVVRIPKGMWHCPLDFKRIDKPLFFQAALQHGNFGSTKRVMREDGSYYYEYVGDEGRPCILTAGKECNYCGTCFAGFDDVKIEQYWTVTGDLRPEYADLVCALPKEETKWGDWCPTPQAYFRGETYMKGANYHVGFQVFAKANDMEDPHFHQGVDEYIFFMGADPMNIFDFECDIDMWVGEDPDDMELHHITRPTVVRIPPTMWHCPIKFRNMKKPLLFQAAILAGCWGTIGRKKGEDGEWTYPYMGDNVRFCRLREGERCNVCGECFPSPDEYLGDEA